MIAEYGSGSGYSLALLKVHGVKLVVVWAKVCIGIRCLNGLHAGKDHVDLVLVRNVLWNVIHLDNRPWCLSFILLVNA